VIPLAVEALLIAGVFVAVFATGWYCGQRYAVRVIVEEEARNTQRVVWLADWLRVRQRIYWAVGGYGRELQELREVERVALSDIAPEPGAGILRADPPRWRGGVDITTS
jgi:hypothetical protein